MNGGVSKTRTHRSSVKSTEASQGKLLDAVARKCQEHPPSHREQPPLSRDIDRDAEPVPSTKRQLGATLEIDALPAKRARLTRTDTQRPGFMDKNAEQLDTATLQQPKPKPPKRTYASVLEDFVDPVHRGPFSEPVDTFVSEWLESVGSDREKRCRSDSHLHHSDDDPVPRQVTRSAPEMRHTRDDTRDADGFAVPPTPASIGFRSYRADTDAISGAPSDLTGASGSGRSSARSLVENPHYRDLNLAANNIYMRNPDEEFPEHIANLVHDVGKDRDSPGPSPSQLRHNANLYELENGAGEPEVEDYFGDEIFPKSVTSGRVKRTDKQPMAKHTVPSTGSKFKVSTPVPDMLYGYDRRGAFPLQQAQLISMETQPMANNHGLLYPFFVIEFKGDSGSMWVATNQALGGSTSCIKIAENLNRQLGECNTDEVRPTNSAAFSIAMNGTEARLYISWKHSELDYYMRKIRSFLLQEPEHYLEFRKHVRNIIDWGKDRRLKDIRNSLDSLLEESRKRASEAAKSRQPPSNSSATSSGKKRRSGNGGAEEPYWVWDESAEQWFHKNAADGPVTWGEKERQSSSAAST